MTLKLVLAGALALACASLSPAVAAIDPAGPHALTEAALHPDGCRLSPAPWRRLRQRRPVASDYAAAGRLGGVYGPLAARAREIVAACGSRVVSGVRRTRVAGTRRMSLHASGRAVDMAGNPACIYAHLRGWPGGYSTDYGRVRHVHISLGGREDGARFAHRSSRVRTRIAWR